MRVNKSMLHRAFGVCAIFSALGLSLPAFAAGGSASVVMYHRFAEGDYPSTSITIEQLDSHINAIETGDYNLISVPDLVNKLRDKAPLPAKTLAITIDDGYESIYTVAYPRFKKAKIPFTIFVSTDAIDRGYAKHLTWKQIREMAKDPLVTIGAHTASHLHMAAASSARMGDEMSRSLARLEEELGYRPDIFAYPFGEASLETLSVVRGFGMKAAFGQHSGAMNSDSDLYYLPRFALNEKYGDLKRFEMVSTTLALPVTEFSPPDMKVEDRNPPLVGFNVGEEAGDLNGMACYASHEGKVTVEQLWERRVEVRMQKPMPTGRTRLSCTMPGKSGQWYWFGRQFYVAP